KTFGFCILLATAWTSYAADLSRATVVAPANLTGPERKAVSLLIDAVAERSRIRWPVAAVSPGPGKPVVSVRVAAAGGNLAAEGYRLRSFDNGGAAGGEIKGRHGRGVCCGGGGLRHALGIRRGFE